MKKVFTHRLLRGVDILLVPMWLMLLATLTQGALALPGLNLPQDQEFPGPVYDTQIDYEEVTPQTWRSIRLEMRKSDGSRASVDLLRPLWWLDSTQAEIGGSIYLSLPELGLEGNAEVLSIGPCEADSRKTDPGQRVVTGKFIHQNARVLDLHFNDQSSDSLGVTSNHPIWSATQNRWIEAGHLKIGEHVRTGNGIAQLTMRSERSGSYQVFNLEVHRDHTYYVSNLGILAHNTYPDPKKVDALRTGGNNTTVNVKTKKEADDLLNEAFPDYQKVRGVGSQTPSGLRKKRKMDRFKQGGAYHKDYHVDPNTNRVSGHSANNAHGTHPHINIKRTDGKKVLINVTGK